MSGNKRRSKRSRSKERVRPDPESFWREDEDLGSRAPIDVPHDATAALRSVGPPPVPGGDEAYNEFLKTVLRASSLVTVLARSVDLVADEPDAT